MNPYEPYWDGCGMSVGLRPKHIIGRGRPYNRHAIECECIEGNWGRARGLVGGAFMGTLLAQQGNVSDLPDGAVYLSHVSSEVRSGQYADTGLKPIPSVSRTVISFTPTVISPNYNAGIFGCRKSFGEGAYNAFYVSANSSWRLFDGNLANGYSARFDTMISRVPTTVDPSFVNYRFDDVNMTTFDIRGKTVTVGGNTYSDRSAKSSSITDMSIYLASFNDNGTPYSTFTGCIRQFKFWQDGINLDADFRSAKDPDGVACFWEAVGKKFYYSKSATPFIAGTEVGRIWPYE